MPLASGLGAEACASCHGPLRGSVGITALSWPSLPVLIGRKA